MKNQLKLTGSKFLFVLSIFVFSLLLSKTGFAQASFEVMCRNKAKEIAADTYKGCMTEQRQSQIEQIRKDYKEKLSNLKNHYDKELKKISSGKSVTQQTGNQADTQVDIALIKKSDSGKTKQRLSGARLPQKKSATTTTTQVIDLSAPIDSQINTSEESVQSESRLQPNMKSSDENEAEIVDMPTQE
ncbi:MAG: hypothetical protein WA160_02980 [Pseudobdellovibrio sp.]